MRVYPWPFFDGPDDGDGGVRRVIEGQKQSLPKHGVEIVNLCE